MPRGSYGSIGVDGVDLDGGGVLQGEGEEFVVGGFCDLVDGRGFECGEFGEAGGGVVVIGGDAVEALVDEDKGAVVCAGEVSDGGFDFVEWGEFVVGVLAGGEVAHAAE